MEKKAINTCEDGTCRTIVAWYAKGGRSNFAAWNGPDRFLMTAVLEETTVQIFVITRETISKIKRLDIPQFQFGKAWGIKDEAIFKRKQDNFLGGMSSAARRDI